MSSFVSHTTVDSRDANALSVFWGQLLGYVEDPDDANEPGHEECMISDPHTGHRILFIEVPDTKTVKNRVHFDLRPRTGTRTKRSNASRRSGPLRWQTSAESTDRAPAGLSLPTPRATSSASCARKQRWPPPDGTGPLPRFVTLRRSATSYRCDPTTWKGEGMNSTEIFEAERPRLVGLATRVLGDAAEAEDIAQQAWLRWHGTQTPIDNLPAWLTTVTTRLCLDRLRRRTPVPEAEVEPTATVADPADDVALADTVGIALQVVLDRLTPNERVAFVLHDSFGFEFTTIATLLEVSPAAARKLASRGRAKVVQPRPEDALADWEVVDAFMAAAREGDFSRLVQLLAPDAVVAGDAAAVLVGTPERIDGRREIATFFNGAAHAALPVYVGERPGSAWFDKGTARVVFDFTVSAGVVHRIDFRSASEVLAVVARRKGADRRGN